MAKVRVRPETGTLYLDFMYQGIRCREQSTLDDTAGNRQKVERLLARIQREISQGIFDYARTFPGSAKADRFASVAVDNRTAKSGHPKSTPVFDAFARQWMDESAPQWRNSYRHSVRYIVENDLIPEFGSIPIGDVSKAMVLQFRSKLAQRPGHKGSLGPVRINKILGMLRQILNEGAERFEYPLVFRNIKALKVARSDVKPFTLDEVERLIDAVRPDYRNYFITRFFTGMRSGEINGLQWSYVDLDTRLIRIRETLVNGEVEPLPKTEGSIRDIPMIPGVYDAIKSQADQRDPACPWVFHTRNGNPISTKNFTNRVWHPLLRHLGMDQRRPYETRHTAATLMLAAGESPEWVARVLGHVTTEMLFRVYSRYVPNLTRQDGRAFAGLITAHRADNGPTTLDTSEHGRDHEQQPLRRMT